MGTDEAGRLSRLNALRRALIDLAIAAHSGRIVKLMGDGALVEFASAVDAVTCAIEIKESFGSRMPAAPKLLQSNSGSASVGATASLSKAQADPGDGVNIAARIEGIPSLAASHFEDAWRQVRDKVAANFVRLAIRARRTLLAGARLSCTAITILRNRRSRSTSGNSATWQALYCCAAIQGYARHRR